MTQSLANKKGDEKGRIESIYELAANRAELHVHCMQTKDIMYVLTAIASRRKRINEC